MDTLIEIAKALRAEGVNGIRLGISDLDGVLRGKIIHIDKFEELMNNNLGFCDVIFGWDCNDVCYDNANYTGWYTGYPDAPVVFDPTTFRRAPWNNNQPFILGHLNQNETADHSVCPRSLLMKVTNKSREMGYYPQFAQEFEWFNFNKINNNEVLQPQTITSGMFGYSLVRPGIYQEYFNAIFNWMEAFNIPLEGLHTETGPGVYEAAIRYDHALAAADKAVLFKNSIKEIAQKFGITASFMAKWNHDLPGCGGHIHQSLWTIDKKENVFWDNHSQDHLSETMKNYLAGQLYCLPHILPLFAPTINSYKRLFGGAWAPSFINWGFDNRTTALRVLNTNEKSCRIEMRVPGADVNPYLAIAASLASGLYGIEHKLQLTLPATVGNGYESKSSQLFPKTLKEATMVMKNSELAHCILGSTFVNHFVLSREWEVKQFENKVTDWELKRYFEII